MPRRVCRVITVSARARLPAALSSSNSPACDVPSSRPASTPPGTEFTPPTFNPCSRLRGGGSRVLRLQHERTIAVRGTNHLRTRCVCIDGSSKLERPFTFCPASPGDTSGRGRAPRLGRPTSPRPTHAGSWFCSPGFQQGQDSARETAPNPLHHLGLIVVRRILYLLHTMVSDLGHRGQPR